MSIIKEFRDFAVKGSAIDMAIGIIIGAAFGKIVSFLVGDVIMPPLGLLIGGALSAFPESAEKYHHAVRRRQ